MKIGELSLDFKAQGTNEVDAKFKNMARAMDRVIAKSFMLSKVLPDMFKGIEKAIKDIKPEKQTESTNKWSKAFDKFGRSIGRVERSLIGAGIGLLGFSRLADRVITKTGGIVNDISRISSITGASGGAIQRMMAQLQIKGLDASTASQTYQQLATLTGGFRLGGTKGLGVFQRYGVNPFDNIDEVMTNLMNAFKNSNYSIDTKLVDAMSIGMTPQWLESAVGPDVTPMLKDVIFLTDQQIANVKKLMESYRSLKVQIDSYIRVLGADLSPIVLTMIDRVREWIRLNKGDLEKSIQNIINAVGPLADAIGVVANGLMYILNFGDGLGAIALGYLALGRSLWFIGKALGLIQMASGAKALLTLLIANPAVFSGLVALGTLAYGVNHFLQKGKEIDKTMGYKTEDGGFISKDQAEKEIQELRKKTGSTHYTASRQWAKNNNVDYLEGKGINPESFMSMEDFSNKLQSGISNNVTINKTYNNHFNVNGDMSKDTNDDLLDKMDKKEDELRVMYGYPTRGTK